MTCLLLTNVGYFISHHVFIMVYPGIWNIRLVPHWHDVKFLKCKRIRSINKKKENMY